MFFPCFSIKKPMAPVDQSFQKHLRLEAFIPLITTLAISKAWIVGNIDVSKPWTGPRFAFMWFCLSLTKGLFKDCFWASWSILFFRPALHWTVGGLNSGRQVVWENYLWVLQHQTETMALEQTLSTRKTVHWLWMRLVEIIFGGNWSRYLGGPWLQEWCLTILIIFIYFVF